MLIKNLLHKARLGCTLIFKKKFSQF